MRPAGTRARGRPSRGPPHVVQAAHRTGSQGPRHGAARGPGQGRPGSAGLRPVAVCEVGLRPAQAGVAPLLPRGRDGRWAHRGADLSPGQESKGQKCAPVGGHRPPRAQTGPKDGVLVTSPGPPHHHLQPRFLHLWGGGLWSSPHRGRVCGRRAQSRTHSLDAKVGAPRPRDRLAQSARPRLGSLGARQLLACEGTWRGTRPDPCDRAATRSKRRAAARAKPVTERCARAELQPPGARRRGRGCRRRPAQLRGPCPRHAAPGRAGGRGREWAGPGGGRAGR